MPKATKFPDISDKVQKLLDADMSHVANRRRARDAFKDVQLSIDHCLFKVFSSIQHNLLYFIYIFFFSYMRDRGSTVGREIRYS